MNILVTGADGMIGRNVAELLDAHVDEPSVFLADKKRGADLRDFSCCDKATARMDRVFHLADHTVGIGYSSQHHGEMLTQSLRISLTMLDAACQNGVKDYLYVSSSCVYPDVRGASDLNEGMSEIGWAPESANEGYGWAKRVGELQARYYAEDYDMRVVIARPANIFGPSYDWSNPHPHVIPSLIKQMLSGQDEITVWGGGAQTRTFMYERDAARMIIALMDKGESGEAYNLGGTEMKIATLAETLAAICQYKGKLKFDVTKTEGPRGPRRKSYTTAKIERLGIRPQTPFVMGLNETVAAAKNHGIFVPKETA